ncbi:MAG: DUF1294 domain-containing protein [Clostridia bacterium]|nr:DUF1294 domain-containing protein [Clostridia bacterium]
MDFYQILIIIFGALSLVTFFMYGIDKFKAQRGKWRISEKALLISSFIGGAVGGFLAMQLFRHKTKHWYFNVVNIIGLVWQIGLVVLLVLKA